jgi:hypothetical protein
MEGTAGSTQCLADSSFDLVTGSLGARIGQAQLLGLHMVWMIPAPSSKAIEAWQDRRAN